MLPLLALFATLALCSPRTLADDDPRFALAHEHLQKGRVDEALETYDALEKAGAVAVRIAIGRSRCFEARGEWKSAIDALDAATAADEKSAPAFARLAELQLAQGDYTKCAATVPKALQLDAEQPLARLVQADLWAATGKLKEADEGYRWFVRYYNRVQPTDSETLLLVARGASQYARWHSTSQIFDFVVNTLCPDALKHDANCWQARLTSGNLLLEKYNRAQALPDLRRALTINPRAADVHAALALAALQDHSLAEAEKHASRGLEINPRHVPSLLVLADLKLEDGDLDEARRLCEQAQTVNPRDERVLARLATCLLLSDGLPPAAELDELFENLEDVSAASIREPSRFSRLVMELANINPHPGTFLGILGEKLDGARRFALAERCYRRAIATMPQLSAPRTALGLLCMRTGRNDEAAKILDQAFQSDPYHVRVSNMRKVLKLLDGYQTITTEHFVVRVDAQDAILGRYMAEFLEEEYPGLVQQFGFEPPTRTQFEVFQKAKGLSAHQWFSARMVGLPWVQTIGASTGMIVALTSPAAGEAPFNWARVLKHEFVHILTLQGTDFNIPHWFTEALAVTNEGYPPPEDWNRLLLERVPVGKLMNLDTLNLGFQRPATPDDWNMAYCQSRLYAQFLTDKFGQDATARLLDAYRARLTTGQAIERVCGIDKSTFEKGYREYLNDLIAGLRGGQREPPLTLAEAEKAHRADPADTRAAARYAFELLQINRRKEARGLAESALAKSKSEPLAALVMARLALATDDVPAAAEWLEPALDRLRPHPQVLQLLAEVRAQQDRFADAAALYELGLARDPDHIPWLKGLASALVKQKKLEQAKTVLEKLATTDADNAAVRQKLAELALESHDFAAAVRYARLALHIDVMDVETHRLLAKGWAGLDRHDKAAAEWSVALELKPDDPDLTVELAQSEFKSGRPEAALTRLKALQARHPDFKPAQKLIDSLGPHAPDKNR
jgi:Tfp pilus assembly protein PilF